MRQVRYQRKLELIYLPNEDIYFPPPVMIHGFGCRSQATPYPVQQAAKGCDMDEVQQMIVSSGKDVELNAIRGHQKAESERKAQFGILL